MASGRSCLSIRPLGFSLDDSQLRRAGLDHHEYARLAGFAEDRRLRLPMLPHSRSLNLSNAAAAVVYEAWRQLGYSGGG